MTNPSSGLLVGDPYTFSWDPHDSNPLYYWLYVGSEPGAFDIKNKNPQGTSYTLGGIPTNGRIVHFRLWSRHLNGTSSSWEYRDYYYNTFVGGYPQLLNPPDRSMFSTNSNNLPTYTWTPNNGQIEEWLLHVGTSHGSSNLFASSAIGAASQIAVSGLPTTAITLYNKFWFKTGGFWWSAYTTVVAADANAVPGFEGFEGNPSGEASWSTYSHGNSDIDDDGTADERDGDIDGDGVVNAMDDDTSLIFEPVAVDTYSPGSNVKFSLLDELDQHILNLVQEDLVPATAFLQKGLGYRFEISNPLDHPNQKLTINLGPNSSFIIWNEHDKTFSNTVHVDEGAGALRLLPVDFVIDSTYWEEYDPLGDPTHVIRLPKYQRRLIEDYGRSAINLKVAQLQNSLREPTGISRREERPLGDRQQRRGECDPPLCSGQKELDVYR